MGGLLVPTSLGNNKHWIDTEDKKQNAVECNCYIITDMLIISSGFLLLGSGSDQDGDKDKNRYGTYRCFI